MIMAEVTLNVGGMTCQSCQNHVTKALRAVEGVSNVEVSLERGTATVAYDDEKTNPGALAQAVTEAGYQVGTEPAPARRAGGCCCH